MTRDHFRPPLLKTNELCVTTALGETPNTCDIPIRNGERRGGGSRGRERREGERARGRELVSSPKRERKIVPF